MSEAPSHNDLRAWLALTLCFIASVVIFIPYVGYSTQIVPIMAELHLDYTQMGTLASVTALAGGIVVYFAGILFGKWGARNVCVAGLLISAAGQFLFSLPHSYDAMLLVRIAQGLAIPLLFVGPYTIAMMWADVSKRLGVFMGVMLATDGIGTVVASYGFSHVLQGMGWRNGSQAGAAALLLIAGLLFLLLREPVSDHQDTSVAADGGIIALLQGYRASLREPNVIVAALFLVGVWGTYSVAIYWVPTLLIEEAGWSEPSSGFVGALYPLAGVLSSVSFGLLSDRLGHRKPLMIISGTGMFAAFCAAVWAVSSHSYVILALTLPIAGLFAYGGLPLAYCVAADAVGVKLAGTATGCIMGTGLVFGGVIYPFVLGYIRDVTGLYTLGFGAAAASLLAFNLIGVLFCRDVPRPLPAPVAAG